MAMVQTGGWNAVGGCCDFEMSLHVDKVGVPLMASANACQRRVSFPAGRFCVLARSRPAALDMRLAAGGAACNVNACGR